MAQHPIKFADGATSVRSIKFSRHIDRKFRRKMSVMTSRAKIGGAMLEMTRTRLWQKASTTPFFQNVVVSAKIEK